MLFLVGYVCGAIVMFMACLVGFDRKGAEVVDSDNVAPLGVFMSRILAIRFYADARTGKIQGGVCRWWHPVNWLLWIVTLQVCGWVGEPIGEVILWRIPQWYRDNPTEWKWVRP